MTRSRWTVAEHVSWLAVVFGGGWLALVLDASWPARRFAVFVSDSEIDSAFFTVAGDLVRRGGTPYLTFWDHKPPLIYWIEAAALSLSGGALWGVWAASLAALVAALVLTHLALRRVFGGLAAALGVVVLTFAVASVRAWNLTELYALPVQCGTMLVLARWAHAQREASGHRTHAVHGLLLGVLLGLAFALKANLIASGVSAALVVTIVLLRERRVAAWSWFAGAALAGAAAVWGVIVLYMASRGALTPFVDQVFRYNFLYAGAAWGRRVRAALWGVTAVSRVVPFALPFAGWVAAGAGAAIAHARGEGRRDPALVLGLYGVVWLPIEVLFASVSGRSYLHYFVSLLPVFAYLAALLGAAITRRWPRIAGGASLESRGSSMLVGALAAGIALLCIANTLVELRDTGASAATRRRRQVDATVAYVRAHTSASEPLFVWGHASDVYLLSGRRPASRHVYPFALLTPRYADSTLVRGVLRELSTASPTLIVDATRGPAASDSLVPSLGQWMPDWRYPTDEGPDVVYWSMTPALRELYDFVSSHYEIADSVGPQRWAVYRRRDRVASIAHPEGAREVGR